MSAAEATPSGRPKRADAQRNLGALLDAAAAVFAESGVDAPAKEISDRAGVGVGTLYRHFPRRSDLVVAVLRHEIDACAEAATDLAGDHEPAEALRRWVDRFTAFVGTKQGLATALHSGDPAYDALPAYFWERVEPALTTLLAAAHAAGDIRGDVTADDVLHAVVLLCQPVPGRGDTLNRRMVTMFVDGLRS